ncbi:hypothetical protein [Salinispora arenicola]|uniref:hypothetical protein n=1 Tax=Salinispora arenicola TaxID=168697 RepID=UPI002E36BEEB|nr:hypothetical protein [Salinispora arenicola]
MRAVAAPPLTDFWHASLEVGSAGSPLGVGDAGAGEVRGGVVDGAGRVAAAALVGVGVGVGVGVEDGDGGGDGAGDTVISVGSALGVTSGVASGAPEGDDSAGERWTALTASAPRMTAKEPAATTC